MQRHRLDRLAALTQGVALVGLGVLAAGAAGCGKTEPIHTNGPASVDPPGSFTPPHVNAPPVTPPASPSAAPSGSAAPAPAPAPAPKKP